MKKLSKIKFLKITFNWIWSIQSVGIRKRSRLEFKETNNFDRIKKGTLLNILLCQKIPKILQIENYYSSLKSNKNKYKMCKTRLDEPPHTISTLTLSEVRCQVSSGMETAILVQHWPLSSEKRNSLDWLCMKSCSQILVKVSKGQFGSVRVRVLNAQCPLECRLLDEPAPGISTN